MPLLTRKSAIFCEIVRICSSGHFFSNLPLQSLITRRNIKGHIQTHFRAPTRAHQKHYYGLIPCILNTKYSEFEYQIQRILENRGNPKGNNPIQDRFKKRSKLPKEIIQYRTVLKIAVKSLSKSFNAVPSFSMEDSATDDARTNNMYALRHPL